MARARQTRLCMAKARQTRICILHGEGQADQDMHGDGGPGMVGPEGRDRLRTAGLGVGP